MLLVLMLKIIMLGLVLAAVALSGIISVASAETVPSPLQQVRDGVPTDEVVCSENRVLMVSQTGMPACVFVLSMDALMQREFMPPAQPIRMDHHRVQAQSESAHASADSVEAEMPSESIGIPEEYKYSYTKSIIQGGHGSAEKYVPALHTVQIPSSVSLNGTLSIQYTFSWFYPNGTSVMEGIVDKWFWNSTKNKIEIELSDEFTLLNEGFTGRYIYGDTYSPHTLTTYKGKVGYSADIVNGTVNIRLDSPLYHDRDVFVIIMQDTRYEFLVVRTSEGISLLEIDNLTEQYDIEQANLLDKRLLLNYRSIFNSDAERNAHYQTNLNADRYARLYFYHFEEHIPIPRSNIPSILVDPHNPSYLPKHTWRGFAAFLGDVILPMNVTDTRSWLLGEGLSETFADDFLQEYPRFVRDSSGGRSDLPTIPESHYIPKSQWGTFAEFMRNVIQTQNVTSPQGWMLDNNLAENFVTDFLKAYPEFATTSTNYDRLRGAGSPPSHLFIYGTYGAVNTDALNNIRVCAYDKNLDDGTHQLLYFGTREACSQTDSDGDFSIYLFSDDPDNDSSFADIRITALLHFYHV